MASVDSRRRLQFLVRAFAGIAGAIAATGVYARGWSAGSSLALGAAVMLGAYLALHLLQPRPTLESRPPAPRVGRSRRSPERGGRRVMTDGESGEGEG